jgi:hypothetical protein
MVWLSGSGGTGETPSHYRITSSTALWSREAQPLSAGIYPDGGPSFKPQETGVR